MATVGQPAPEFDLQDQNEQNVSLNDFEGRWLVLYFYPKDDTPGCTTEARDFTAALQLFESLDAEVVGVSPDKPAKHRKFIEKHQLGLRLLCDVDHAVMEAYGAWGLKKMYGREYEGVIRSTFLIDPQGNLAHSWPKVRVKGHVEKVRQQLEELRSR